MKHNKLQVKTYDIFLDNIKNFASNFDESSLTEFYSLSRGIPGLCILYSELHEMFPNEGWDKLAHDKVIYLNNNLDYSSLDLSLYHGLCGIAAGIHSLANENNYQSFMEDLNTLIINRLEEYLTLVENNINKGKYKEEEYDLISGCSGILRYLLVISTKKDIRQEINRLIQILVTVVLRQIDKNLPSNYSVNMGTAHGLSGVLAVLSSAYLNGYKTKNIKDIIFKLVNFFEHNSFNTVGVKVYPESIPFERNDDHLKLINSSWCYGLTGINRSLILASRVLKNTVLEKELSENYVKFLGVYIKQNNYYSAILCHGTSSILYEAMLINQDLITDKDLNFYIENLLKTLYSIADFNKIFPFPDSKSDLTHLNYNAGYIDGTIGVYLILLSLIKNKRLNSDWIFLRN